MRTLWLCFNGNAEEEKRLQIPVLEYPLSYNIPRASWADNQDLVYLNRQVTRFAVHVDILIELGNMIRKRPVSESDICAYRLCIGVADTAMADNLPHRSIRDIAVNEYYARFHEASNIVGPVIPVKECDELRQETLKVNYGKGALHIPVEWRLKSQAVLDFLAGFTTLRKGDFISLGSIWRKAFMQRQSVQCSVGLMGQAFSVQICD